MLKTQTQNILIKCTNADCGHVHIWATFESKKKLHFVDLWQQDTLRATNEINDDTNFAIALHVVLVGDVFGHCQNFAYC